MYLKRSVTILVALFLLVSITNAQSQVLEKAASLLKQTTSSYSESDAASAIKEALNNGTKNSVDVVSKTDGYFKNTEIKIPFPSDAKVVETKLRSIGMGTQVDKVVLSINRAAETAAKDATSIFLSAITKMTINDAINIVKGDNNAATAYLKNNTSAELKKKFKPVIKKALDQVYATKYWSDIIKTYNKIPLVTKMNPDLADYVTGKAIEGLFIMIAKEELKIRKDPVARTTELLKKVFGN
jgi:hypothetical protein